MLRRSASQVYSTRPDGTQRIRYGSVGHVAGLTYGSSCPGGDDQLGFSLQIPPSARTPCLDPGRRVFVVRGGGVVWQGKLNEPQPSASGWAVSAHGLGTEGSDFVSTYGTWNLNDPVNQAITRGLRWVNTAPGITAGWLSQQVDSGSQSVTDFLNSVTVQSSQVWQIDRWGVLKVGPIPSVANRLLVATGPVARTITNDLTTIWIKYQASDDGQGNVVYNTTDAFNQADINQHGPSESYADLSNAGTMTSGAAQNVGNAVLARYQRAAFAGPFTVRFGQYLTTGGTPVDLGTERAGTVVRLLVTDAPFGGEQVTGLIEFVVGAISYSDDDQTAQITPMNSARSDFASLLSLISPGS